MTRLSEEARQIALAEAEDLDAARAAAAKLTDAACRIFYVEIEARLARSEIAAATPATPAEPADQQTVPLAISAASEPASIELPFAEAKRLVEAEFERDYLSRLMAISDGCVTEAAKRAGVERCNFRKLLLRNGLRPRGTRSMKAEPDAKYTEQILKILDEHRHGLRTYEIAEKTKQPVSNAFGILKLLNRQGRVERHGERYNTLWTLPGISPVARIETIPAAAVAVLSKTIGPMDAHRLRDEMSALLHAVDKPPTQAALNRGISRLVSSGTLVVHGANEHGAMYALAPKEEAANLN